MQRQAAAQFERAEQLRSALNLKPMAKRTLADYRQVVSSYRRVYLITPRANEVPDALVAIARLNAEMGERFGRTYYQAAVDAYRFLLHEYPASHLGPRRCWIARNCSAINWGITPARRRLTRNF